MFSVLLNLVFLFTFLFTILMIDIQYIYLLLGGCEHQSPGEAPPQKLRSVMASADTRISFFISFIPIKKALFLT